MDSRWIPLCLGIGWVLLTWGIWGAFYEPWWIWPISFGILCLVTGSAYAWALAVQVRAQAREKTVPGEVRT